MIGTVLGVGCMSLITNIFNLFEVTDAWQNVVERCKGFYPFNL
jgi:ribose/xylose/arabinose/galactoside ABC-type transport system permease subunit